MESRARGLHLQAPLKRESLEYSGHLILHLLAVYVKIQMLKRRPLSGVLAGAVKEYWKSQIS